MRPMKHHFPRRWFLLFILALLLLAGCGSRTPEDVHPTVTADNAHVQPLTEDLDSDQATAQNIALASDQVLLFTRDISSGAPLRSAVFGVYPVLPGDVTENTAACANDTCYRVDLYNFATNTTYHAWVDMKQGKVLHVNSQEGTQPDLPPYLVKRAIEIASTAPEVIDALGFNPAPDDPTMPNVKTALNQTTCERSRHLCVAPTFLIDNSALWAIVDLTDEKLVGVRWTYLGESAPAGITQLAVESEDVFEKYCQQTTSLERNGWSMDYDLTSSDGLRLSDVSFDGKPVLQSAKNVDWHVSYSGTDGFGYSDAIGCPIFSQAAVGAYSGPVVDDLVQDGEVVGFTLTQDFYHPDWPQPCNYRYQQRYEFYNDGRFRVVAINLGRGCGDNGTYRPVLRIHLTPPEGGFTFAEWDGAAWQDWTVEGWQLQDESTPFTPEGYQYRLLGADGSGFYLEPGQGQFPDNRGDNALVYVTTYNPDEGDADMVTIGPCCNEDYQQGPEKFINDPPESLAEGDIVIWYVGQMHNDATPGSEFCWADSVVENGEYVNRVFPCAAGPMFVPLP